MEGAVMKRAISRKNLWEKTPRKIKSMVGMMLQWVPPDIILGKEFRRNFLFVEKAQWWSADESHTYQLNALRKVCNLAFNNTEFYKEAYKKIGFSPRDLKDFDVFQKLPFIDKKTINDNLDKMCCGGTKILHGDYTTTGGTSGEPLRFYIQSDRSQIEYAYLMSSWRRIGYQLGTPLAVFRGRAVKSLKNGFPYEFDPILRHHYYSNFFMSDNEICAYLDDIKKLGECFLHVYPSSAFTLARFIRKSGYDSPKNIKGIIAESENVYDDQKKYVKNAFGCRFFSCYGHTEKLVAGAECEKSENYHIWPTYGFFELIDENGKPITTPGKHGEIVGTGFINRLIPFIRYRTGDFANYVSEYCKECGRMHPIIKDIRGHRIQEYLVTNKGTQISWTALNMHNNTFDNVLKFQFYQDTPGYAILKIIPGKNFFAANLARITKNLSLKIDQQLKFDIKIVESLPLTKAGKAIYVDQRLRI